MCIFTAGLLAGACTSDIAHMDLGFMLQILSQALQAMSVVLGSNLASSGLCQHLGPDLLRPVWEGASTMFLFGGVSTNELIMATAACNCPAATAEATGHLPSLSLAVMSAPAFTRAWTLSTARSRDWKSCCTLLLCSLVSTTGKCLCSPIHPGS